MNPVHGTDAPPHQPSPNSAIVAALLLASLFACYALLNYSWVTELGREWSDYHRQSLRIAKQLDRLQAVYGYGGFIHQFKNWVLGREPHDFEQAGHSLTKVYQALNDYRNLALDTEEYLALDQIEATVNQYAAKYRLSGQPEARALSPTQLDALTRVEDRASFAAIALLRQHAEQRALRQETHTSKNLDRIGNLITGGLGFALIILFGGGALVRAQQRSERLAGQLAESERLFRSLAQLAPVGIFRCDPQGRKVYVNQRLAEILDRPPEDCLDAAWIAVLHPEDRERVAARWHAAVVASADFREEYRFQHADGGIAHVITEARPERDAHGTVTGYIGTCTEISQFKQMVKRLKDSEARFRAIFEQAGVGVAVVDSMTGRFVRVNRKYGEMVGHEVEALLELTCRDITHPDDLQQDIEQTARLNTGEIQNYHIEKRYLRPDGTLVWVDLTAAPLWAPGEAPARHITVVVDITERRRMRAALEERERHILALNESLEQRVAQRTLELEQANAARLENETWLRAILDNTHTVIFLKNLEGRYLLANQRYAELFGLALDAIPGQTDADIFPPELVATLRANDHAVIQHGIPQDFEEIVAKTGEEPRTYLATKFPLRDAQGRIHAVGGIATDITDRKRAEAAREASEERLKLGIQVAGLALAEVDYHTGLNHLSAEAAQLFGLGTTALCLPRALVHATFHPDDHPELMARIAACLDPKGPGWFAMDHRVVWPDGQVRWLRVRKQVFFEGVGAGRHPVRAMLAALDVTAKKTAAEAARRSEEFVRGILDSLPQQVVVLDESGVVRAVNEPWVRFARENSAEDIAVCGGANYLDVYRQSAAAGDPYAQEALTALKDLLAGRRDSCVLEYPYPTSRHQRWFLLQAQRLLYGPPGLIVSHIDITERKQAEEALRNQEERIRTVLHHVVDAIITIDAQGLIHAFNPAAERIFGYRADEVIGRNIALLMPEDIGAQHDGYIQRYLATGEARIMGLGREVLARHQDGHTLPCDLAVSEFQMGGERYFTGVLRDITERRAMLEALAQAKECAEQANQAKSLFLANMSHEIRTPINAIMGMTELCLTANPSDRQRNYLVKIGSASKSLLHIIDDILDFSKIEAGKLDMVAEAFTLAEVCESLVSLLTTKAEEKNLRLAFEVAPGLDRPLIGDARRLNQVLVNLMGNAIKFSSQGRVTLTVVEEHREDARITLKFAVHDQGIGIAPEAQARLFQPFSQADASTTRGYGGTGLGLAISKRLVDMMHGHLWVDSVPGQGSVFQFTARFGLGDRLTRTLLPRGAGRPLDGETLERLRGTDILVVEDAVLNQEVMTELLERAGFRVRLAANGEEALCAVESLAPTAILMDCHMPVMDGFEATWRLRADPRYAKLPIIALTANAMAGDRERCLAAGMNDFVTKPVNFNELLAALACWIKAPEAAPAAPATPRHVDLPTLPGIDTALGLQLVGERPAFYLKLLRKFRDSRASNFAALINTALDLGDWEEAHRLAHSLKGTARTFGATSLGEMAGHLETATHTRQPQPVAKCLSPLLAELDRVLAGLAQLDRVADRPAPPAPSQEHWHSLCLELDQLLEDHDLAAVDGVARLDQALLGSEYMDAVQHIAQAIANYDFTEARIRLRRLGLALDVSLPEDDA